MADMIIVEPFALTASSLTVSRGSGSANLVSFDPREVWQDSAVGTAATIDIDIGSGGLPWDVVALINTNAHAAASWSISSGSVANTTTSLVNAAALRLPSEDVADPTGPAIWIVASPQTTRLIRVTVTQPANQPALTIGGVIVGKGWKPAYPREPGTGRPPLDTGTRTRLDDGGLSTVPGTLLSGFKWVFGDLDPAELAKLWGLLRRRRTTEPVLLIEDPADLKAETVHYGTFTELESYERRDQSKSRWAMSFEDWV